MQLAICDDNLTDLEALAGLARRYGQGQGLDLDIATYNSVEGFQAGGDLRPDVLLLDIYLKGDEANGLALAGKLRAAGFDNPIILVTSSRDHFADGYTVGALHYLVKPVDAAGFAEAMRRARLQIGEAARTITVTSNRRQTTVPLNSILYIEVTSHQTRLVTTAGVVPLSTSLVETVALLGDDARFVKCFRSFVVNMDHIVRIDSDHFIIDNGDKVPIAKREAAAIRDRYMSHLFVNGEAT